MGAAVVVEAVVEALLVGVVEGKHPLEEALDDAYFTLLLCQAIENPWQRVDAQTMPWMRG